MGGGEGYTHRTQYVRRLQGAGCAGGAAAGADSEFVEHEQNGFTLDVLETYAEGVGQTLGFVAIQHRAGTFAQDGVFEVVAQFADMGGLGIKGLEGKLAGFSDSDNVRDVFGSGAATSFLVSANEQRSEPSATSNIQYSNSFGSVELVA